MSAVPESLHAIAAEVEARLDVLMSAEQSRWETVEPELRVPLDALEVLLLSGGKRLRPAFCHWAFVGAGGDPNDPRLVDAGAALELLHAFALVHDDVMDGSATRRGARTTHLVFADRHGAGGWSGEARRFGEGVAILVGDLAFAYADMMMHEASTAARSIWNELRIELNIGQYLDLVSSVRGERDRRIAECIRKYKSAKYTVERPLHLGAMLAAPERVDLLAPLSAYGLPVGDAFQLRDDVLGVFGEADVVGKPVGDDLREGKPTALLAITTQRAAQSAAKTLSRVGAVDLADAEISELQQIIVDSGALAEVESEITRLTDVALRALRAASITSQANEALVELAHYVAWRDR
jgi:geranylgeranyl diphosphate synthase, type I